MIPTGSNLEQKRFPKATLTIIIVTVVFFLLQMSLLPVMGVKIRSLAYGVGNVSLIGLFTSIFLHGDVFHIVFNMVFLWAFGPAVEDRVGPRLFFVYYLGAGIAANLFALIVEYVRDPTSMMTAIGASGAVSGIMGLYLYRCFYSKVKMVLSPLYLPFNIHIPAAPIILFWFFRDVFYGMLSLSTPSRVAHWAHVGGFLFAFAVGRIKRYGHEAAKEHYTEKVNEGLRAAGSWKDARSEKELLKLVELTPDDPDLQLQLGQYYAAKGDTARAVNFYRAAIQRYFSTDPLTGAFAVLEYQEAIGRPAGLPSHLKAAELLAENGYSEEAYKTLHPVADSSVSGLLAEKTHALFVRICRELHREDEARTAAVRFSRLFPRSRYLAEVKQALNLRPGSLFPKRKQMKPVKRTDKAEEAPEHISPRDMNILSAFQCAMRIVTDPTFLFLWFFLLFVIFFFQDPHVFMQLLTFVGAFIITAFYRINWTGAHRSFYADEKKARNEVDIIQAFDRASLAERGDNFLKAATLYEKTLALDPRHAQARFNLARIYMNRLLNNAKALLHFRMLLQHLPPEHPYHGEAQDMVLKLKVKPAKE